MFAMLGLNFYLCTPFNFKPPIGIMNQKFNESIVNLFYNLGVRGACE